MFQGHVSMDIAAVEEICSIHILTHVLIVTDMGLQDINRTLIHILMEC